ncbi:hypothetical protein Xcel_0991 [Xylanimonas cellulosilytica DSM 15894]|uniref:Uncharacterized protein n=1 Tax=Xylanimonas cellulosilytica (strain DSM 15894 / JCM 12276 / CECT 5975 / KCTC 9989 / LMG 20990 / NBRC 107835 / XIL07) TaxID=446471 RepID=D1BYU7_XYLCX|nr:hypothetical protein Xcel_0991 [Xylanimonas cellulosilytica DSM 15894]
MPVGWVTKPWCTQRRAGPGGDGCHYSDPIAAATGLVVETLTVTQRRNPTSPPTGGPHRA